MKRGAKIAVFASGTGSNFQRLIERVSQNGHVTIVALVTDRDCKAMDHAKEAGIPSFMISKEFTSGDRDIVELLTGLEVEWVILAGFLRKIPSTFIRAFENHIVNLHPALLPKFGGKGMYGRHVHEAVVEAGEQESGITIHLVNEQYDEGPILKQFKCDVLPNDTAEDVERKVRELERLHFSDTIIQIVNNEL